MNKLNYKSAKGSIFLLILISCFWIYNIYPSTIERNNLVKVSGTFKVTPHYETGTKGSAGAEFELNEYRNTTFGIPSGIYEHLDRDIFIDSKKNDSITFYIEKKIFENRLEKTESYSFFRDFLDGQHIRFYDLIYNGKNYLKLESFNEKVKAFNPTKHILIGLFFLFVLFYVYKNLKK